MQNLRTKILVIFSLIIETGLFGCSVGDDDFVDTKVIIQQIIEKDQEGLFEPGLTDDGDSLFTADLSKSLAKNGASDFWKTAANNINFGRLIQPFDPKKDMTFDVIVQDTIAYATVNYLLKGSFVIDSAGNRFTKILRHRLSRFITFVQRENPATGDNWVPITVSAAYGSSLDPANLLENTRLAIDSIWIAVPQGNIIVDDPAEIVNYYGNPITLHNNDSIVVYVKVRNKIDGFDRPVGFITNGKNKENQFRRRLEMTRIPFTDYFRKTLYIEATQRRGFNQLVIDFLTQSAINKRARPYDSYMIAIPYKVQ
jgi:hypothetical protein